METSSVLMSNPTLGFRLLLKSGLQAPGEGLTDRPSYGPIAQLIGPLIAAGRPIKRFTFFRGSSADDQKFGPDYRLTASFPPAVRLWACIVGHRSAVGHLSATSPQKENTK